MHESHLCEGSGTYWVDRALNAEQRVRELEATVERVWQIFRRMERSGFYDALLLKQQVMDDIHNALTDEGAGRYE